MSFLWSKDRSVIVGEAAPGETAPRRNIGAKDGVWEYPDKNPEMNTVWGIFTTSAKKYADLNMMGWRESVALHTEEKMVTKKIDNELRQVPKKWVFYELSEYKYITYSEALTLVKNMAAGIISLGVKPSGKEIVHICAQTSAAWLQFALACNANAIPVATAYDTLGEEGITHSLVQTGSVAILVDNAIMRTLPKPLQKATGIRIVIYKDDIKDPSSDPSIQALLKLRPDLKVISLSEVVELGKKNFVEPLTPKPEDIGLIMYTSGSTGPPKGVVLTNGNISAGVAGATANIHKGIVPQGSRLLAFLPLAHILEFTFELATLYWGGVLGYGTVKTISDVSMRNCYGDIREFKPTVMAGVPAVWESIRKGILAKISKLPAISQKVFWAAYYAKGRMNDMGLPLPLVDNLIFKQIKEATGGNLSIVLNGGAAIAYETQRFITTLLCPMIIGYGLTETNANTCLMTPSSYSYGTQGELTHAVSVKLVDVADAGYFAKNNQGEILIKGPSVSSSYYKNEEETKAAFTDDGWFRSGDIGEWTSQGHIKLVDRKKNLVKTANGEYIAIEKLETIYRTNSYIQNICVYADQTRVKPVAIIVPNPATVNAIAKDLNIEIHEDISHEPKVKEVIEKSIIETGTKNGLKGIELILGVIVAPVEWTPQNGFLTSAQKLERRKILAANKKAVDELYNNSS